MSLPVRSLALLLMAAPLVACGHTEEEWQVQIDKNTRLVQSTAAAEAKAAQASKEADEANRRAADASKQLEAAGGDSKGGAISSTLAERERALGDAKIRARLVDAIKVRVEVLRQKLDDVVKAGGSIGVRRSRMVVTLPADLVFDKGGDRVGKQGRELFAKVRAVIKSDPMLILRDVTVAVHTDDKAPKGRDSLGLTTQRAHDAALALIGDKADNIGATRVTALGVGDGDPLFANDKDEGRARNRRVEITFEPTPDELLDVRAPQ